MQSAWDRPKDTGWNRVMPTFGQVGVAGGLRRLTRPGVLDDGGEIRNAVERG
jgi:hypothetical protein